MKYLASSILALAGVAILTASASAASTPDIIVGFQATAGTGNTINLEVDLGSATQFFGSGVYANTSGIQTLSNLGTDLSNTYGANWATSGLVKFGIIGAEQQNIGATAPDGQPKGTIYGSKAETTPGTASSAWANNTQSAQKVAAINVINLYNGVTAATPATAPGAVTTPTSDSNSYTSQENNGPNGSQFNFFSVVPGIDNTINTTGGNPVSDLFQIEPNNTTLRSVNNLGAFSLDSGGNLLFDTNAADFAPIPEPATLGFGLAMIGAVAFRRFRTSAIA